MITPKSIDEVKAAARVEEVLGEFIDLRRAGVNLKGPCPFHDEKTPSFVVSPAKGIYKCFGCGMAGDSVRFLMDHEKLSYPEAIRWIANKYNNELEETEVSEEVRREIQKKDSFFIINGFAQKLFQEYLLKTNEGRAIGLSYFKERGFLESTVEKWGLGYAPEDRHFLFNELKQGGYNLELAHELGLLKENRDFFHSRIVFPIRNLSGKIIGIGARTLSSNKRIPKYINSPESEIYNKRKTLFGLYFAKTAIRKKDTCYMVEGYTDVISLHQNGIENVVASSGTALTVEQIKLVKRFSENITVVYDGDSAGINAALRGLDLILEQDMNVRLLLLPDGEDPDSYVRKVGHTSFTEYVSENSKDFILFKIDLLLKEAGDDPIKRSKVVKDIVESISKITDSLKRNEYVKLCSRLLDVPEITIQKEANKLIKQQINKKSYSSPQFEKPRSEAEWDKDPKPNKQQSAIFDVNSHEAQERDIVRILMTLGDNFIDESKEIRVYDYVYQAILNIIEYFDNELYVEVIQEVAKAHEKELVLTPTYFLTHPNEEISQLAIEVNSDKYYYANWKSRGIELQTQAMPKDNYINDFTQSILRLKSKKLQRILEENQEKIKSISPDDVDELRIKLKVIMAIKTDLAQINNLLRNVVL